MSIVTIELPDQIRESLQAQGQELSRLTLEALAVEGYRLALLSHGQVSEMLGMDYWQSEGFLKAHRVFPNYDIEDFKEDLATLKRLEQMHL